MATVNLVGLWLHDDANRSDYTVLRFDLAARPFAVNGEIRRMANGRKVIITRPGDDTSVTYPVPYLDDVQYAWLLEHAGRLIMARDSRGKKMFGTFFNADINDRRVEGSGLSLTFQTITYSEVV